MNLKIEEELNEEWENFISSCYNDDSSEIDMDEAIDENIELDNIHNTENYLSADLSIDLDMEVPKASDIYISTKTKIAYLNQHIDLKDIFWKIPVIPYAKPCDGVIKKQMKFNSTLMEELDYIKEKLKDETYFEEYIITSINNPNGRIKFKDIRKVSIGVSKKDLMSYRCKKKSAFYNCFVIILRMKVENVFKEFHVKVFNTGKLEIPGVQNETSFQMILQLIIDTIQPHISDKLEYKKDSGDTVLINSNFNCGYFVNREILYDILKFKYNIQCIFDPCSYPGIQCKFYFNPNVGVQTGCQISEDNKHLYKNIQEVSFMIFRTGSVLISGKCDESMLMQIYEFIKNILTAEFKAVCHKFTKSTDPVVIKDKKKKIRKKNIIVNT
jgi:hypothetical protein